MTDDSTLIISKVRAAIAQLGPPVPDFIVTTYVQTGSPVTLRGQVFLSPADAEFLHAEVAPDPPAEIVADQRAIWDRLTIRWTVPDRPAGASLLVGLD